VICITACAKNARILPLSASAAARIDLPGSFRQTRSHGLVAAWRPIVVTWRDHMTDALEQIGGLLHEAGETHHRVYRIVDGADDDWASWYAQWLIDLSELPDLLGARPVRSELVYLLVSLDKHYTAEAPGELWETYYARQILRHFRPSGS
jgi:hypothetical protein